MAADPMTNNAIDEIFNDDLSDFEDDLFANKPALHETRDDKAVLSPRSSLKRKVDNNDKENDGLGLDQEVKIAKKRKPVAKLDDERLLSQPGIPKLRALTRSGPLSKKLRTKGKGHEFSDAARLLNHFQLWLDNLYPRAKFADALQLVEKAGHSKKMQIMRNEWINESKPGYRRYGEASENTEPQEEPDLFATTDQKTDAPGGKSTDVQQFTSVFGNELDDEDALFIPDANRPSHIDADEGPDDDELDALLAAQDDLVAGPAHAKRSQQAEESEGEDDLDALLAEQDTRKPRPSAFTQIRLQTAQADEEDDDLDALLAEQGAREARIESAPTTESVIRPIAQPDQSSAQEGEDKDEDEDELEALLAQKRIIPKPVSEPESPSLPTPHPTSSPTKSIDNTPRANVTNGSLDHSITAPMFSSSPVPNNPEDVDLDDLDALLASQEAKTNERLQQQEEQAVSTPKANKFAEALDQEDEDDFLGSPVPNEESQ